jgi:hypothetical protein
VHDRRMYVPGGQKAGVAERSTEAARRQGLVAGLERTWAAPTSPDQCQRQPDFPVDSSSACRGQNISYTYIAGPADRMPSMQLPVLAQPASSQTEKN